MCSIRIRTLSTKRASTSHQTVVGEEGKLLIYRCIYDNYLSNLLIILCTTMKM